MAIEIMWSNRFRSKVERATKADRAKIHRTISKVISIVEMGQRHSHDGLPKNFKALTGQPKEVLQEFNVSPFRVRLADDLRLIYAIENAGKTLSLLDIGHRSEVYEFWDDSQKKREQRAVIERLHAVDEEFAVGIGGAEAQGPLASMRQELGEVRETFIEQYFNDWVLLLDDPQYEVFLKLCKAIVGSTNGFELHVVLGGPGTGKTLVLTRLAGELLQKEIAFVFLAPEGVRRYLLASHIEFPANSSSGSIQILDDPITADDLVEAVSQAKQANSVLVVAIDPTQWHDYRSLVKFEALLGGERHSRYELRREYRQGGKIGRTSAESLKRFFRTSTHSARQVNQDRDRQRRKVWESLCLDELEYVDNAGTVFMHEEGSENNYLRVVVEACKSALAFPSERDWPEILVAMPDENNPPPGLDVALQAVMNLYPDRTAETRSVFHFRSFDDASLVRGTEYIGVILLLDLERWRNLTSGLRNADSTEWEQLSKVMTFLTRAENVLAVIPMFEDLVPILGRRDRREIAPLIGVPFESLEASPKARI